MQTIYSRYPHERCKMISRPSFSLTLVYIVERKCKHKYLVMQITTGDWWEQEKKKKISVIQNQNFWKITVEKWKDVKTICGGIGRYEVLSYFIKYICKYLNLTKEPLQFHSIVLLLVWMDGFDQKRLVFLTCIWCIFNEASQIISERQKDSV